MSAVECNCPWNPDSHAETCPVYMRDRIDALAAECEALRAALGEQMYKNSTLIVKENEELRTEVARLRGDAERGQWLGNQHWLLDAVCAWGALDFDHLEELDAHIRAALTQEPRHD